MRAFADIPEALANTVEIAKRCNVTVRLGEYFLPQFPTGDMSTEDYLVKRAKEGLEERLAFLFPDEEERLKRRPEYDERLDTELQVINQMGFPGYFLIVMEFIQWSKITVYGRARPWFWCRVTGGLRVKNHRSRSAGI